MNEKNMLLRQIQTIQFAMWELHMFLDTHPNNIEAQKSYKEYQEKNEMLVKRYEEQFGPLTAMSESGNKWEWISTPWPWENSNQCGEECMNVEL